MGGTIISPYPFVYFSSALLVLSAGYIISSIFFKKDSFIFKLACLVPLTSPFYLENLSYRYDSLPMALSVLMAVLPFKFKDTRQFCTISILCLTIALGLYQTSAFLFFAITLCIMIDDCLKGKIFQFKKPVLSALLFITSLILYELIIYIFDIKVGRTELLPISPSSITIIGNRINAYTNIYHDLLESGYINAITPTLIMLAWVIAIITLKQKTIGGVKILVSLVYLSLIVILTTLPNLILQTAWLSSRTMICFPVIIFPALIIGKYANSKLMPKIINASLIILIAYSFTLSCVLGTLLKSNDESNLFMASLVTSDIANTNGKEPPTVVVKGYAKPNPRSELIYNSYPIMKRIAPIYIRQGWYWGVVALSRYTPMSFAWGTEHKIINDMCSYRKIKMSEIYSLRQKGNTYIIDFDRDTCTND